MTILDVLICRGTEPSKEEIKEALDFIETEMQFKRKKLFNNKGKVIGRLKIYDNGRTETEYFKS